jgi:hypothetical protein
MDAPDITFRISTARCVLNGGTKQGWRDITSHQQTTVEDDSWIRFDPVTPPGR